MRSRWRKQTYKEHTRSNGIRQELGRQPIIVEWYKETMLCLCPRIEHPGRRVAELHTGGKAKCWGSKHKMVKPEQADMPTPGKQEHRPGELPFHSQTLLISQI